MTLASISVCQQLYENYLQENPTDNVDQRINKLCARCCLKGAIASTAQALILLTLQQYSNNSLVGVGGALAFGAVLMGLDGDSLGVYVGSNMSLSSVYVIFRSFNSSIHPSYYPLFLALSAAGGGGFGSIGGLIHKKLQCCMRTCNTDERQPDGVENF